MNWKALLIEASIALVIASVLVLLAYMEHQDRERARETYCSMVALFKTTQGEYGWPEYDGPCED